jgi:hypothetical protein
LNPFDALRGSGLLAYIDPNAGGWLFQMLFPVFVAIGGVWIVLRKKLSLLWKRLTGRKGNPPTSADDRK